VQDRRGLKHPWTATLGGPAAVAQLVEHFTRKQAVVVHARPHGTLARLSRCRFAACHRWSPMTSSGPAGGDGYISSTCASKGELSVELPQVGQAAEPFVSKLFPRGTKLLRTEPLRAMVIAAFVRGLSMRDVESLCEQAGLGKLSKSTASRICAELRERFEQFQRRDPYDIELAALFLDAVFLSVRPDGPKEGVLVAWGFSEAGERVLLGVMLGCASPTRTGSRSAATSSAAGLGRRC
jgi:putative transposase